MSWPNLDRSVGFLLKDIARLYGKKFDQRVRRLGLTLTQARAISYLLRHEGIHQAGLADLIEVEPITLARLLDRMEEAGWVERRPDPADRRARKLFLTDKVQPVLAQMQEISDEVRGDALAGLRHEQTELLIDLLRHVHANLSDRPAPPADPSASGQAGGSEPTTLGEHT